MDNHALSEIVQHGQVGMDEFIVKFDLLLSQLVVVCVHLVDQLTIEVYQLLKFLFQETPHTLLFTLFNFLFALSLHSASKVGVD
jgi:hypothetical protein